MVIIILFLRLNGLSKTNLFQQNKNLIYANLISYFRPSKDS